jgi:hypothetical protein
MKEAKLHWVKDSSEINGDNLNNIRRETSRYFRGYFSAYYEPTLLNSRPTQF